MPISTGGRTRLAAAAAVVAVTLLAWAPAASGDDANRPGTTGAYRPGAAKPTGMQVAAGPFSGHLGISADGLGVALSSSGTISAKIHDPNSTILTALLYVKPNNYATPSQIGFAAQTVPLTFVPGDEPSCCPDYFRTYRADVTSIVASVVGSGSGTFNFTVDESVTGYDTTYIDGEALYVVYQDDALPTREIYLYEGGMTSVAPEALTVPLLSAYAGGPAKASIGDSFSTGDCTSFGQVSTITVQGNLLSDCAGGYEDGDALANGALMTVGGIGDEFLYPPASGKNDDEKYNIVKLLTLGDTSIDLTFTNPSDDDSIFVLAIGITMPTRLPPAKAAAGLFE